MWSAGTQEVGGETLSRSLPAPPPLQPPRCWQLMVCSTGSFPASRSLRHPLPTRNLSGASPSRLPAQTCRGFRSHWVGAGVPGPAPGPACRNSRHVGTGHCARAQGGSPASGPLASSFPARHSQPHSEPSWPCPHAAQRAVAERCVWGSGDPVFFHAGKGAPAPLGRPGLGLSLVVESGASHAPPPCPRCSLLPPLTDGTNGDHRESLL